MADALDELADLLQLQHGNPHRTRAYRRAARTIEALAEPVQDWVKQGRDLTQLPYVGEAIAAKVHEIVGTGTLRQLESQRQATPALLTAMTRLEGLGPRKVQALREGLGITDIAGLQKAAEEGRVAKLKGFGEATQRKVLDAIARLDKAPERRVRPHMVARVRRLQDALAKAPGVERVDVAGSFRRQRDTVADLDFVAAGTGEGVFDALRKNPAVADVLAEGPTRMTVRLDNGMQVDLRLVPPGSFGAAMVYFTGSKAHNIRLRALAQKRKLRLNEYGLHKGDAVVAGRTEEEVYEALGLQHVPPEMREDHGEVELALQGKLPRLVELKDLKGDLHTHTDATDGRDTLPAMVAAAHQRGHAYIAVTDHTSRTSIAGGMKAEGFREQWKSIARLNAKLEEEGERLRILKGAEVDILKDGRLDLPDDVLAHLDVTVCSLHFRERMSGRELTERVLKAMASPHADILGHPTARMLGRRPPMDLDWERLAEAARDQGWAFEVDGDPMRQDLPDDLIRLAHAKGCMFSLDSDAHATFELGYQYNAVAQARRGWLESKDVLNTRDLKGLRRWLDGRQ